MVVQVKSIIAGGYANGIATTAGTTTYMRLGATPVNNSNEAVTKNIFRTAGTFSNLYIRLSANTCSAGTVYTVRQNGAIPSGAQTVTIPAGLTGEFEDTTNSNAVVAGDTWTVQIAPGGGSTGTNTITVARVLFTDSNTANTTTRLVASSDSNFTAASSTYYLPLQGSFSATGNTIESHAQHVQQKAGTMKNLSANISANTRTDTLTFQSRLNGSNGTMSVSFTSLQTGIKEDTLNSDSVSAGDKYNLSLVTGTDGAHSMTMRTTALDYVSTGGFMQCALGSLNDTTNSYASTAPRFAALAGTLHTAGVVEINGQMPTRQLLTFSNLSIGIHTNTAAAAGTLRFRIDAGNGNQVVPVGAGLTGWFSDTTNQDPVLASDEVNYSFVAGDISTTSIIHMSCWATTTAAPTPPTPPAPQPSPAGVGRRRGSHGRTIIYNPSAGRMRSRFR